MASKNKRRSNTSSPAELEKALKLCFTQGINRSQPWNQLASCDMVVEKYEEFITELVLLTTRPTKGWLLKGCLLSFPSGDKGVFNSFSERIIEAVRYCFQKRFEMKSGKKTQPAVKRIVKIINQSEDQQPATLGGQLLQHSKKRFLEKKNSEATSPSPSKKKKAAVVFGAEEPASANAVASFYQNLLGSSQPVLEALPSGTIEILSSEDELSIAPVLPTSASSSHLGATGQKSQGLWFDPSLMIFVRKGDTSGQVEPARACKSGKDGFVVAQFGVEWVRTEMTNLEWERLEASKSACKSKAKAMSKAKAKAEDKAKACLKKPASSGTSRSSVRDPNSPAYALEYRQATNAMAIRKKWKDSGKALNRQIGELRHQNKELWSREDLHALAQQVVHKILVDKSPESDAVAWGKEELKKKD